MIKFYIANNLNRCEPEAVKAIEFIHVKSKTDGSQTALISKNEILDPNVVEKTQEELQTIVDEWIDEENQNPFFDDVNQVYVLQKKINLEVLLG
jgi:hypothetical protein